MGKWRLLVLMPLVGCTMIIGADGLRVADEPASGFDATDETAPPPPDATVPDVAADVPVDGRLVEPNLVAAWLFDEPGGTIAIDATGNGHDGQLQGSAVFGGVGVRGGAVVFSGGADAVVVPSLDGAAFPRSGTFSIHFNYDFADILSHGLFDNWTETRDHLFFRHANGAPVDEFQIAGQYVDAASSYAFVDTFTVVRNVWTHVVFTWNEASRIGNVYLNGVLSRTDTYDGPYAPHQQIFRIGANYIGRIDEVRLYDRSLTAVEASAIP